MDIRLLLRIWDLLFYQGSLVLFQVTLGMLKIKVFAQHHLFRVLPPWCSFHCNESFNFFCWIEEEEEEEDDDDDDDDDDEEQLFNSFSC